MKKIFVLFLMFFVVIFSGCGEDGDDGKAFLKLWWTGTLNYYSDNNSGIPGTIYSNTYYAVSPGTYSFSYTSWDFSSWSGTYTITVDEGEDGGILPGDNGDDGDDSYFELALYSTGPDLYDWGPFALKMTNNSSILRKLTPEQEAEYALPRDEIKELWKSDANTIPDFDPDGGNVITVELRQGRYKIILKYVAN